MVRKNSQIMDLRLAVANLIAPQLSGHAFAAAEPTYGRKNVRECVWLATDNHLAVE
jgi:hypothetical protein